MIEIICSHASDGNMSKKYCLEGKLNRNNYLSKYNIKESDTVCLNILNCDIIKYVDNSDINFVDADAIITNKKNIFLYQVFADCIPMVIYDKEKELLGFAHLGWKSIYLNLHVKLIDRFIDSGSSIDNIKVILGPSIKKESYIKDNPIQKDMDEWINYVKLVDNNMYSVDIFGKVIDDIKNMGIINIKYDDIDTYSDKNYFSHMRSINNNIKEERFLYGVRMR